VTRRRVLAASAITCAAGFLVGCSTSPGDFKSEGEKFLQSPELAQEAGYRFSDAECENPPSTEIGTQFTCTATDNDGDDWEFLVEITGERSLTVISGDLVN
jgi:hypothetical protein